VVQDRACVELLRWALPRLGLRWPGFRRVRRQVCRRVVRRARELGLADIAAYREHLERTPAEWPVLDALCRITISRFYRDRAVFDHLGASVLPALARAARARAEPAVRCWSAGCASGEEPYSLALVWAFGVGETFGLALEVVATESDQRLLERATRACYPPGALRELPPGWAARAFTGEQQLCCLRPTFRKGVRFLRQDIRLAQPEGPFDLVLCRNLAFTYFDHDQQRRTLRSIADRMRPGAALVVGKGETPPDAGAEALEPSPAGLGIYWKAAAPSCDQS
jgi:chemotaxis protein methyltransferase CheR